MSQHIGRRPFATRHLALSTALRGMGVELVDQPADDAEQSDAEYDDGSPLRLRIVGNPYDVADAVFALRQALPVTHVSGTFPAKTPGKVAVYVHAEVPMPPGECAG